MAFIKNPEPVYLQNRQQWQDYWRSQLNQYCL